MPGLKSSYCARTVDVCVKYSDDHWWCNVYWFFPEDEIIGVLGWMRGGGGVSSPKVYDYDYDPEEVYTLNETHLQAGIAFCIIEYPNFPRATTVSSEHPTKRMPHNWRTAQKAFAFMQSNALNGRATGSRSRTLPTDWRYYAATGPSAGAMFAASILMAPVGLTGYEERFRQSFDPYAPVAPGRIGAALLEDVPLPDFRLYDRSISGDAIQFFGRSSRWKTNGFTNNSIVNTNRWDSVPTEFKRDIGLIPTIQADAVENRQVAFLVNNSLQTSEASYFNSGLTFSLPTTGAGAITGSTSGATTISVQADLTKTATVKHIASSGTTVLVYAEPNDTTNLADWTGTLVLSTGATAVADSVTGADTRKTFVTRQAAIAEILASNFAPVPELTTPHPVVGGALIKHYRDEMFAKHPTIVNKDVYRLGSHYPALISGDLPSLPAYSTESYSTLTMDFFSNLGWPLLD